MNTISADADDRHTSRTTEDLLKQVLLGGKTRLDFKNPDIRARAKAEIRDFAIAILIVVMTMAAVIPSLAFMAGFRDARAADFRLADDGRKEEGRKGLAGAIASAFLVEIFKRMGADTYEHLLKPLVLRHSPGSIDLASLWLDTPSVNQAGVYWGSEFEDYKMRAEDMEDLRNKLLLHRGLDLFGLASPNGFVTSFRFLCPIESICAYRIEHLTVNRDQTFQGIIASEKRGTYAGSVEGRFVGALMAMRTTFLYEGADGKISVPESRFALAGPMEVPSSESEHPLRDKLQRLIDAGDLSAADRL